ncbi:MAG: vWA domain-containing protein [Varibaculum sp.]|nr:vWA domain-containing protein [Varibaculum sp.]
MKFIFIASPLWLVLFGMVMVALIVWAWMRDKHRRRLVLVRRILIAALVLLIGATPALPHKVKQVISNVDVYFLVDTTGSMSALDYHGDVSEIADKAAGDKGFPAGSVPRFAGMLTDIDRITGDVPQVRYAIVSTSSRANLDLPLTSDLGAVESWVETYKPEVTAESTGSDLSRALDVLERKIVPAQDDDTADAFGKSRVLIVLSDGEVTSENEPNDERWAELAPYLSSGAVLGYGTATGAVMPEYDSGFFDVQGSNIQDPTTGADAISRMDAKHLNRIAAALGVQYYDRNHGGSLPNGVTKALNQAAAKVGEEQDGMVVYRDFIWPFALVLLVLMLWETWYLAFRQAEFWRGGARPQRVGGGGYGR